MIYLSCEKKNLRIKIKHKVFNSIILWLEYENTIKTIKQQLKEIIKKLIVDLMYYHYFIIECIF